MQSGAFKSSYSAFQSLQFAEVGRLGRDIEFASQAFREAREFAFRAFSLILADFC